MTFSTLTFLLVFLPTLLAAYYLIPPRFMPARNGVLLIFSLLFYAWGEPVNIALIIVCIYFTYLFSFGAARHSKTALVLASIVNLAPLVLFKYSDFIILNINNMLGTAIPAPGLALPIGISFYTFQVLTYVIDLYRGRVSLQRNPAYLALYIFLFPQLIAGPIVRYSDIESDIRTRVVSLSDIEYGAQRFITGLAKKMLIANQAGHAVSMLRSVPVEHTGAALLWTCVLCYGVQIYFDFSGYSDMAIGLGRLFGFHFNENFNKPYISRSITDFWRRWHISLSGFFRDYVYIPLGGSRVSAARHIFNLFVVWGLTGLWHGAFWNYILWGLYYFVLLTLEKYATCRLLEKAPAAVSRAASFVLIMFGWAIFLFETNSPTQLCGFLGALLGLAPSAASVSARSLGIQGDLIAAAVGLTLSMTRMPGVMRGLEHSAVWRCLKAAALVCLFAVCLLFTVGESFNPFIYFRF